MEKIAAIDIGSNAVRFTTADLESQDEILLDDKIRVPLRLGSEAFGTDQAFSKEFIKYAKKTFKEIRKTLDDMDVVRCRAVATSAVRDARNSDEFKEAIFKASGIRINTISGDNEAELILKAIQNSSELDEDDDYLLIDLGGGSLELSIIEHGEIKGSQSVDLGTVRMLEYKKKHKNTKDFEKWMDSKLSVIHQFIKKNLKKNKDITVIGTGGNFRRLVKLRATILDKKPKYVRHEDVAAILKVLEKTTYLERIKDYDLRPDRADVIVPAIKVISRVLESISVDKIYAPNIGLIQGVLLDMSDGKTKADQLL